MAQPSPIDKNYALEGQLREMYGRAAYTHKTHQKMADAYVSRYKHIKLLEIILSASTTTSLIAALLGDSQGATVVGAATHRSRCETVGHTRSPSQLVGGSERRSLSGGCTPRARPIKQCPRRHI